MTGSIHSTTVNGHEYTFWSDFIARGSFAKNITTGETKLIRGNGYVSNDLTARKAIACVFHEPTFRK